MASTPKRVRTALIAVAIGIIAGAAAQLLFAVLPEPWNTLANTSALWGLVPFFVTAGLRARGRHAVAAGILSLAMMVISWTALAPVPVTVRELSMWAVVAVVAGALCGLAGSLAGDERPWRRGSARPWLRRAALAFMGGLVLGEGLYGILVIGGPQWWAECAVGLALPLTLARRWPDRVIATAGASVVACALFAAYLLYDAIAIA